MSECKCEFDGRKCNSNQNWNYGRRGCECKKHDICEKYYIWNPTACSCKNGKFLANITDDSWITCNEIIKETKPVITNSNEENETCKTQNFYILLAFLLIITALLIAASIYRYLIKYKVNQKHLLSFHVIKLYLNWKWIIKSKI